MSHTKRKADAVGNVLKKAKTESTTSHWKFSLFSSMKDPSLIVYEDEKISIIKDKYPKAEFHYLVIPKEKIESLEFVKITNSDLLLYMEKTGGKIIQEKHPQKVFKIGYHAKPSLPPLHLHIISDDMKSDHLKTKKHWNSFTTDFFLKSEDIREQLQLTGKVNLPSPEKCKQLINQPLKCHKCNYLPKTIPDLKKHLNNKH